MRTNAGAPVVAIVGSVPAVPDPDRALVVGWSALLAMFTALVVALVGTSGQDGTGPSVQHPVGAPMAQSA